MKSKALLFLLMPLIGHAQNLVPNGSFEEYVNCPDGLPDMECTHWLSSLGTPDYFNACSLDGLGVPNNVIGYQNAQDGEAFCGLVAFELLNEYRELLSIELENPLTTNMIYYYSFWVCRANNNTFDMASNNMGIKLSSQIYLNQSEWIDNTSMFALDSILTDSVYWTLIKGQFIASESYSFLTIGNFYTDSSTSIQQSNPDTDSFAYYFIDNVKLSSDSTEGWPTNLTESDNRCIDRLTVSSGNINFTSTNRGKYIIYSSLGQICLEGQVNAQKNSIAIEGLSKGIYFFSFVNESGNKQILEFIKL